MKNNEYIEKYGEKALEVYRRAHARNQGSSVQGRKKTSKSSNKSLNLSKTKPQIQHIMTKFPSKKKLNLCSGMSTPSQNLTQMRANDMQHSSPSTKKKKFNRVQEKLVGAERKRTKSMVREVLECLDVVMKEETRLVGVVTKLREVVGKVVQELSDWKQKYKKVSLKNKQLEEQIKLAQPTTLADEIKTESHIKEENNKLKVEIEVLKQKITHYQKKQITLLGAIDQLRIHTPASLLQERKTSYSDLIPSSTRIPSPNNKRFQEEFYGDPNINERGQSSEQDDHY